MRFTKMQGLGNDYIYMHCPDQVSADLSALARRLSDRHFGIGSDGLILILPSTQADFRMQMFNADGSEGLMCGNGIRCVGKYVYDKGLTDRTALRIETASGVKDISLTISDENAVSAVTVDMGCTTVKNSISVRYDEKEYTFTPAAIGNPHLVCFVDDVRTAPVGVLGASLQADPRFPGGINVEFLQIHRPDYAQMRVYERGSGETLACGTGACAAFAVAESLGLLQKQATIALLGGELSLTLRPDGRILMTGNAVTVFEGDFPIKEEV
jgi:diaminopimelate epimerase